MLCIYWLFHLLWTLCSGPLWADQQVFLQTANTRFHWNSLSVFWDETCGRTRPVWYFMQCTKRRAFSLVSFLELEVFRRKNVPGPHFGREGVDNGEDWRDVCTQRSAFMAFDIAWWHVTCMFMRGKWSYQSVIRCVLGEMYRDSNYAILD